MTSPEELERAALAVRGAVTAARRGLVERDVMVELVALTAVAEEHLLVVGPPGTAKSEGVRRVARELGGVYFEYLLGRFTEPSEIFGPVDLRRLREGVVETETTGMLPEAEIAFLDEIFLGSTAILNTLLGLLNERVFRRGHTHLSCPLKLCVGATNQLPDDEALAAFGDRFLARIFVEPLPDPRLEELLAGGWSLAAAEPAPPPAARISDLETLSSAARTADLAPLRPRLAHALRLLRGSGVALSDRRAVKIQRLIAAAAALSGRTAASEADLWPIIYALPTAEAQRQGREVLRDLLAPTESRALGAAAEEASHGPRARAGRLTEAGRRLLSERPPAEVPDGAWRAKLEGVAREIDAGFTRADLPAELLAVREQISQLLQA